MGNVRTRGCAGNDELSARSDGARHPSCAAANATGKHGSGHAARAHSAATHGSPLPGVSEVAPDVTREFRGVWVASVANIDWPSSRSFSTGRTSNGS